MPPITSGASHSQHHFFAAAAKYIVCAAGLVLLGLGMVLVVEFPWLVGLLALVGVGYTAHASLRERLEAKAILAGTAKAAGEIEGLSDSPVPHH